jgi:hypothetical protein
VSLTKLKGDSAVLADIRNIVIAILAGIAMVLFISVPVFSQSWKCGIQTGLVSVESTFMDGTYTWVLTNRSSLPEDPYPDFDILVWSLIPSGVNEPLSWVAPEGWRWAGDRWEIDATSCQKYKTPPALAPGQTVTFMYTPDPNGKLINDKGPQPPELVFIAHVGAVVPNSGSLDGGTPWTPTRTEFGKTWFDRPMILTSETVPEPSALLQFAAGVIGLFIYSSKHVLRR